MIKKKQKVYVAMSGGVDSSVAAALLKRDGFSVVGVYMKCWAEGAACTSQDDERSARLAASHLGIPFYTWNFIKEYRKKVVEYMLNGYAKGVTPNPDIMCNKEIKFGLFFDKAMKLGADYIATGHYARLRNTQPRLAVEARRAKENTNIRKIEMAKDKNKDQSYFLSFIKPEVLSRTLFPIGNYTKQEVRALARKFGLPNAERKSSQGVCFIGKIDFEEFLKQYIPTKRGNIVDIKGNVLGEHEGVPYYTIGQRKGIGLSGGPYYVVDKNLKANLLVVSKEEKDLYSSQVQVKDLKWFLPIDNNTPIETRIRYRQEPATSTLMFDPRGETCTLIFTQPQRAITPGQIAVMYQKGAMVAGGVIA